MPTTEHGVDVYVPRPSIGGSDIGKLLGVNSYGDARDVYNRITAILDGRPVLSSPDNNDMERGRELEEPAVRKYEREQHRECIRQREAVVSEDRPYMHANVDRLIIGVADDDPQAGRGTGILEIKCPRIGGYRAAVDLGVPPSYYAQVQHYLAVTDYQWASFGFLNAEDWKLHVVDVERDEPMILDIFEACDRFWSTVMRRAPVAFEVDTSTRDALVERARETTAGTVVCDSADWREDMRRLRDAREAYAFAKTAKERAEEVMKEKIEALGADAISIPGVGKITYKEETKAGAFDSERFAADHPGINLSQYKPRNVTKVFRPTWGRS